MSFLYDLTAENKGIWGAEREHQEGREANKR